MKFVAFTQKHLTKIILGGVLITTGFISMPQRFGPSYLYPNPKLTSGLADTLDIAKLTASYEGKTYSQTFRNVPRSIANQIYEEYGIKEHKTGDYEVDHFYPISLGGSNDPKNLWPQPAHNLYQGYDYGYHAKDRLETYVVSGVKKGNITPQTAYECFVKDWVSCYNKYIKGKVGIVGGDYDQEDEIE